MKFWKFAALLLIAVQLCLGQNIPDLPNYPQSPLTDLELDSLSKDNSKSAWENLASKSKEKALEKAANQAYPEAASWIYTSIAAKFFAEYGEEIPPELKKLMLKNLPAFFDFCESWREEDNLSGAAVVLKNIYAAYPAQTEQFLRMAMAISLIYDISPPPNWPECNMPSNPAPMTHPQDLFYYFVENAKIMNFPMQKLTVSELIFTGGIAGPIDELRSLLKPNLTPYMIEKLTQSLKTDYSRIERNGRDATYAEWDVSVRPFTLENIRKYGGTPPEKVYYAWRVANANGIPCIYFSDKHDSKVSNWLAYMSKLGVWKFDVCRSRNAVNLYGRPLNPQTWKPLEMFDIEYLCRRPHVTENGMEARVFLQISNALFEGGKYENAAVFADKSKKSDPEYWKAYKAYIAARARFGAASGELDALWRKSYEPFRRYPEMCMNMLEGYRRNLALRRMQKEADRLLIAEMRTVMRNDPGLAVEMYSQRIRELMSTKTDIAEIFSAYKDILRNSSGNEDGCFSKIVRPMAESFAESGDYKNAIKTLNMFAPQVKNAPPSVAKELEQLKKKYTKDQNSKTTYEDEDVLESE